MTNVAFIGLGHMGLPMAKNLLQGGFDVVGFDLSEEALIALEQVGGKTAPTAVDALGTADVAVTMLTTGAIVSRVLDGDQGCFQAARPGTLFIDASTIDVETARGLARAAHAAGHYFVDAPVSGGVKGAADGTLAFMVGGSDEAFEKAKPVLQPMAGKIVHAGDSGNGQAAKACNNMLLAISMIGVSEAFNLGRSLGLDDQTFFDIASNASGQCWSLISYCPAPGPVPSAPSNNGFKPGFATDLMLKDLRLALDAIEKTGVASPLGREAEALYAAMAKEGHGGEDFSAVIEYLRRMPQRP